QVVLRGPQLLVGGTQAAEELTVRDGRSQQVRYQIQELDLVVGESAGTRAQAVKDADRLDSCAQGHSERRTNAAPAQLGFERGERARRRGRLVALRTCQIQVLSFALLQAGGKAGLVQRQTQSGREPQLGCALVAYRAVRMQGQTRRSLVCHFGTVSL